jgi:hypothetical protein
MSENYLNQAINGAVRTTVVLYPTLKASQHLLEITRRTLNAALGFIGLEIKLPPVADKKNEQAWKEASIQSKTVFETVIYLFTVPINSGVWLTGYYQGLILT